MRGTMIFGYVNKPSLVCLYQISAMRQSFRKLGLPERNLHPVPGMTLLSRALKKAGVLRNLAKQPGKTYIVPVLRLSEGDTFPVCYLRDIVTWSFDCWPGQYDDWESFFRRHRIRWAFISAKASALEMDRRLPDTRVVWLPEAADPDEYMPEKRLETRKTAVLELGRKFDRYHSRIQPYLLERGLSHMHEGPRGEKIFGNRLELAQGLGDARISICFPRTMTHPQEAGGVETATFRYFESIASKCLLVGKAPPELIELFGYNPVIEADLTEPATQLEVILTNLQQYEGFVERNYKRLLQVGTWDARAEQLVSALMEETYE